MAQREKKAELVSLAHESRGGEARLGRVVSFARGELRVDYDGNGLGPLPARVSSALDDTALSAAARDRQDALLLFENGDPARPVVVALLRSATPLVDAIISDPLPRGEKVARLDGRRVVLEGHEEVVLRCGKASLTLRRDGRVELRGVNVATQAEQVHKIRGGKVQIN
jgi:Domain of unknown function (DUF6484)